MKKLFLIFQLLILIVFYNCDSVDPDGNGDPTDFNGTVIFKDIDENISAEIVISGVKNDFPTNRTIVSDKQTLPEDGTFTFSFEGDKDIDYYILDILENQEVAGPILFNSTDCGNLNCEKINPGSNYDNLVITVELK